MTTKTEFQRLQQDAVDTALGMKCPNTIKEGEEYGCIDGVVRGYRPLLNHPCPACNGTGLDPIATAVLKVLRNECRCRKRGHPGVLDLDRGQYSLYINCPECGGDGADVTGYAAEAGYKLNGEEGTGYILAPVWEQLREQGRLGALAGVLIAIRQQVDIDWIRSVNCMVAVDPDTVALKDFIEWMKEKQ
jgi:Zn finger protein HypA/HybF involved in hydrogenase expression